MPKKKKKKKEKKKKNSNVPLRHAFLFEKGRGAFLFHYYYFHAEKKNAKIKLVSILGHLKPNLYLFFSRKFMHTFKIAICFSIELAKKTEIALMSMSL